MSVEVCYQARRGKEGFYISDAEMHKASTAFKKNKERVLARDSSIDIRQVEKSATAEVSFFAALVIGTSFSFDSQMERTCRELLSAFPPDIDKTVARRIDPPTGIPNKGQGLIIPVDPRFQ